MLRILLVDDEPLVLIGLQGMLEWEKLGYTVCGTARNGKLALELIEREKPDIVIADVKMPVMDGLTLARTCRERSALPAFIMLTSFEEFGYIKQAMGAGVVDYLVKLDLTPENLQTALAKAAEKVKKERALLGELSAQENLAESVRSYQERFFVRLYAGLFPDEAALEQPLQHMELNLASDAYLVASCEIIANTALTPAQQLKLSFSCGRMLETTLQNYLPCYVTGADAMRCNVLFCLTDAQCQNYRTVLRPLLERASQILYNYFTVRLLWAVGRPTGSLLGLARCCRENAHLQPLLTVEQPIQFVEVNEGDATASAIFEALAYQVSKEIAAMTAVLSGRVDAIVLTGGIAKSQAFAKLVTGRISYLAPIVLKPGEEEMDSLAYYLHGVLTGAIAPKEY